MKRGDLVTVTAKGRYSGKPRRALIPSAVNYYGLN